MRNCNCFLFSFLMFSSSLVGQTNDSINCTPNEVQLKRGIQALFDKEILEESTDTLFVAFLEEVDFGQHLPKEIVVNSKKIEIDYSKKNFPCLWIRRLSSSKGKEKSIYIKFYLAKRGATIHEGQIIFECIEGRLRYWQTTSFFYIKH